MNEIARHDIPCSMKHLSENCLRVPFLKRPIDIELFEWLAMIRQLSGYCSFRRLVVLDSCVLFVRVFHRVEVGRIRTVQRRSYVDLYLVKGNKSIKIENIA